VTDIRAWRAVQAELVLPKQLPDGLLEVSFADQDTPDLFLVEISTYPDRGIEEEVLRDAMLVFLDRRVLPEILTVVLHPKGRFHLRGRQRQASRLGWTRLNMSWRVVELWNVPAETLLAANDVGLIPWVPLTQFAGPPEPILQLCRERIDQRARPEERDNLLAVSQIMTRLRYNDAGLLAILGGSRVMIESPLIQELWATKMHKVIERALAARFGTVPAEILAALQPISDEKRLDDLHEWAIRCPDLEAFRTKLVS
jgi:hypothetical protein